MCRGGVIHVSQQTLYAQGISEVRKTGHKGIISHQICRTCLRPAMWAVRVLKVVDSSQNSQGLRSEHNFCMVFAHLEAQPAGPLVDSVRCQGGNRSGRMGTWTQQWTCVYLFKML